MMRRLVTVGMVVALGVSVWASGPYWIGNVHISATQKTALVSGKVGGLENVSSVDVTVTAVATCAYKGKATSGYSVVLVDGDQFPVNNGVVDFDLGLSCYCPPPASLQWSNIDVTVNTGTEVLYSGSR